MAEEKSSRSRNWTFVVYPESAPEHWRDILDEQHFEWVESPLHEFDVDPNGEVKKAHWHILVLFNGSTSFSIVKAVTDSLNAPIPLPCHNAKSLVRYMAHLDNPDKYQYPVSQIVAHGGVDVSDLLRPSSAQRYAMISAMCDYIKAQHIVEFQDIVDFAKDMHPDDWFPLLCDSSAFIIDKYIKSQRHRNS